MSKKNKDIEVRIEDIQKKVEDTVFEAAELFIGKKSIGEVVTIGPKEFWVFMDNEKQGTVKTAEEGFEWIIRQWNLQD